MNGARSDRRPKLKFGGKINAIESVVVCLAYEKQADQFIAWAWDMCVCARVYDGVSASIMNSFNRIFAIFAIF